MNTNRLIAVAALAALLTSVAGAQDVWTKQSVLPTNRTSNAVFALTPDKAVFVGDNNLIMDTTTAGSSWTVRRLMDYGTDPLYAVSFATPEIGLISGNNQLLRTTNSGTTWQPISFWGGSWYHIDFVNSTVGFVGANGALAMTSDAGESWSLRSQYPDCPVIFGMDFRDANVGLVGGIMAGTTEEGIYKTSNGGQTWVLKDQNAANDVLWTSATRAIADEGATVRESVDSGDTWHTIAGGITTGFVSMTRAGTSNVVIGVSGKGDVWRSPDLGFTWVQTFDGPGALPGIWETHFADANHGWLVGPGAFIYYTTDSGFTWQQKNSGTGTQVYDIQMLNPNYGLAVGHDGYVFRTNNGGNFWDVKKLEVTGQIFGRDENLVAVDVVDSEFAVVAGPGGTVFKTENGGDSWTSIGYPVLSGNFWIYDVDFIDHNLGYIYGVDFDPLHTKTLFRTTNGGATWDWVYLGERGGGTTVQFVDADYGWLTADNTFGLRTINGGASWTEFHMPDYFTSPEVSKVRFLNRNYGWVVGWNGYAAKSFNGGATWQLVDLGTTEDHFFDVIPVSETEIWICGRENFSFAGVVYHSINGGQTWTRQVVSVGNTFTYPYRFTALPTGDAWYGGYAGTIARRQTPAAEIPVSGMNLVRGRVVSGTLQSVLNSDNTRLELRPGVTLSTGQAPTVVEFTGNAPTGHLSNLTLLVESAATSSNVGISIDMFDYNTGQFVNMTNVPSSTGDQTYTFSRTDADRFTSGTGEVKCRVSYKASGPTTTYPWTTRIDWIHWQARQ